MKIKKKKVITIQVIANSFVAREYTGWAEGYFIKTVMGENPIGKRPLERPRQ